MIIHVKQACEFINEDGEKFHCANGFIGCPPEWVANDEYFKLLCNAGKITAHIDSKDVDESAKKEEHLKEASKKGKK